MNLKAWEQELAAVMPFVLEARRDLHRHPEVGGEEQWTRAYLEKALQDQKDAFGFYPVMNNTERLDAAKVVTQGDYAALLIVGISPEDPDAAVDFSSDVSLAEDAFYAALK